MSELCGDPGSAPLQRIGPGRRPAGAGASPGAPAWPVWDSASVAGAPSAPRATGAVSRTLPSALRASWGRFATFRGRPMRPSGPMPLRHPLGDHPWWDGSDPRRGPGPFPTMKRSASHGRGGMPWTQRMPWPPPSYASSVIGREDGPPDRGTRRPRSIWSSVWRPPARRGRSPAGEGPGMMP